jgi:hypothetical protein
MPNDIDKLKELKERVRVLGEKKIVAKTRLEEQKKLYEQYVAEAKGRGIEDVSQLPSVIQELSCKKTALSLDLENRIFLLENKVLSNG